MISLPKIQAACPSSVAQTISVTMGKILKSTELLSRHLSTKIRGYAAQFPITCFHPFPCSIFDVHLLSLL